MSFWDTFVKVWQVRKSVEIQESIVDWFSARKAQKDLDENIHEISREVYIKNKKWNEELEEKRNKK
jgi:hypothetical protein